MKQLPVSLAVAVLIIGIPALARAQGAANPAVNSGQNPGSYPGSNAARNPDWPCQQILVPSLSPATVWDGPAVDDVGTAWRDDPAIAALVAKVTDDAVDPDSLQPQAEAVATAAGGDRDRRVTLVFAGAFQTLDRQRDAAIASIERYARHQRALRERIAAELRDLDAAGDAAKAREIKDAVAWDRRILDDRRRAQSEMCDQPVRIERRLGRVARMLSGLLS